MRIIIRVILNVIYKIRNKYYKRKFQSCGHGLSVFGKPRIMYGKNMKLGNNVNINDSVLLNATGSSIEIGNEVTISAGAKILAATYDKEAFIKNGKRKHIGGDFDWQQCLDLC